MSLSAQAAETQNSALDHLNLHIINNSSHTLTLTQMAFASNVRYFVLKETTIPPLGTADFQAAADVSSDQPTKGLGGTLYFTINGATHPFIIADSALGANLMPVIGFGVNDPDVSSTLSDVRVKQNPKPYDLSIESATVTIIDKLQTQ